MCLSREKFIEICEEFPDSVKVLKYKAYLRRKFFKTAKESIQAQEKSLANLDVTLLIDFK